MPDCPLGQWAHQFGTVLVVSDWWWYWESVCKLGDFRGEREEQGVEPKARRSIKTGWFPSRAP